MQLQLSAPKIWLATQPVDFRKGVNGLCEQVAARFDQSLEDHIYVFYNQAKDKLKLLAHHRNGIVLIYKRLDKKKFTLKPHASGLYEINDQQLSWLLAGLDWLDMSHFNELTYSDYF